MADTATYDYDPPVGAEVFHPAAVTSIDHTTGADDGFAYDDAGRMVSRTVGGVTTALTWDVTSSLTETTGQGGHVIYAYDASGQRVVQARIADAGGAGGTATAYTPAGQLDDANTASTSTGDVTGTRYYTFGGSTVAVRTATGLSLMFGDEQGSTSVVMPVTVQTDGTLASATLADAAAVTRTSYTPFGELRGGDNAALDRGWLGQVEDRVDGATGTGLTYLNARYYDPATMRFISPDPLMNPADPKTLDPYRYADNNPVVFTDASGLAPQKGVYISDDDARRKAAPTIAKKTWAKVHADRIATAVSEAMHGGKAPASSGSKPPATSGGGSSGLSGWFKDAKSSVSGALDSVGDAASDAWKSTTSAVSAAGGWVADKSKQAWDATEDWWNDSVVPWWKEYGDEVVLALSIAALVTCLIPAVGTPTCAAGIAATTAITIGDGMAFRGMTGTEAATLAVLTVVTFGVTAGALSATYAGVASASTRAAVVAESEAAGLVALEIPTAAYIGLQSVSNLPTVIHAAATATVFQ